MSDERRISVSYQEAEYYESIINPECSYLKLDEVSDNGTTGVEESAKAQNIYSAMRMSIAQYNRRLKTDAKNITEISWDFREIDGYGEDMQSIYQFSEPNSESNSLINWGE